MIIDSHVHLPADAPAQQRLLEEAAANGINLLIVSDLGDWSHWPSAETVRLANERAAHFHARSPDRVRWLAYLNPQLDNWRGELARCLAAGAAGVKLWVSLKSPDGSLANTAAVLKAAAAAKLPALLHVFNLTDPNHAGEITMPEFVKLKKEVPDCTMIAAHAGGNWRHSLGLLRECGEQAYLDISGGYPEAGMLEGLLKSERADRILFGSDAPGRSFSSQKAKVTLAAIDETTREAVFYRNAARLYGIAEIPPLPETPPRRRNNAAALATSPDHFCFCGDWPFSRTGGRTPAELEALLAGHHPGQAYTGDLTGIFNLDLPAANRAFLRQCAGLERVLPLASLNPSALNWSCQVDEAAKSAFAGGLISPYLHSWNLADPAFADFFAACAAAGLRLWVNCAVADYRFRQRGWNPLPPEEKDLIGFMHGAPASQYVFQGLSGTLIRKLLGRFNADRRFCFEFSKLTDSEFMLEQILEEYGPERLVFGSEFPFRHLSQVRESAAALL